MLGRLNLSFGLDKIKFIALFGSHQYFFLKTKINIYIPFLQFS